MEHPSYIVAVVEAKAATEAKAAEAVVGDSSTENPIGGVDLCGKRPLEDNEEVELIFDPPPFDDNIIDDDEEEASDDVGSDVELRRRKTRDTLTKLKWWEYDKHRTGDKLSFPVCKKNIGTDFRIVMMHVESLGSIHVKVGENVNVASFMAKHMVYGIFLRKKHNRAIELGRVPSPKPKKGSKWRRSQREAQE